MGTAGKESFGPGKAESYRLHRESDVSLIPLIAQCDYNYMQFSPAQTIFKSI